jgi:hypothetical protein
MPLNNTTDKSTQKLKRQFWICINKDFFLRLIKNASVYVTKLSKKCCYIVQLNVYYNIILLY